MDFKELFEEVLEESYRVDTSRYENSQGKKPRGSGNWIIKVNGKDYNPRPNMGITDAIRTAIKMAHEQGNKQTVDEIIVMP